jgi:hypothetical protein
VHSDPDDPRARANRRPLGYIETLCALGHDGLHGAAQGVFVAEIDGPLTPELAIAVFVGIQASHPLLRARLERDADGYAFNLDPPAPPVQFMARPRDGALAWDVAEAETQAPPVDARVALWRATLLHDPDQRHLLVFSFHHAIADGLAGVAIIEEFLAGCAAALAHAEAPLPRWPLAPPIEERLIPRTRWADFSAAMQAQVTRQPELPPWPYAAPAPVAARLPRRLHHELTAPELEALARRAAAEGTTLTGAFAAAMLFAAAEVAGHAATSITTSVNLRGYAAPEPRVDDVGCSMTNVRSWHTLAAGDEFWQVARAYREALRSSLVVQGYTPADYDFPALARRLDRDVVDRATHYPQRLGLSNLGVVAHPERRGPFAWTGLHMSVSRRAGFYVGFLFAHTFARRLSLCFCYVEPLLASEAARSYFAGLTQRLHQAITGSPRI